MDKPEYAYFQGKIVPFEEANVSVMTQALHYGLAVFGGMRGYWNEEKEQLFVFRSEDHFKRLTQSAAMLRMFTDKSPSDLTQILLELLRKQNLKRNIYIRPLVYKSDDTFGVIVHDMKDELTIIAVPMGDFVGSATGLHVCFSSWHRVEDNAIPARGKISGTYVNSTMIRSDAQLAGYDDAIVLNADGQIAEASVANFFMIRNGTIITPPVYANLLEGITRRTVIEIAQDVLGLEVVERPIDRSELYIADEAFMCGTGAEVSPITRVEHRDIGDGQVGTISQQLREAFLNVVYGRDDRYQHWLTPVYE